MKSLFRGALIASLLATPALANEPSTDLEKLSYSLGMILGERVREFGDVDPDFVLQGIVDSGKDPSAWKMDRPAINKAMQDGQARVLAEREAAAMKVGEDYLIANAKKDGVKTTASGLQYRVLNEGSGSSPSAKDKVKVHYEGRLINGQVFDSSYSRGEPVSFPLDQVIPGWTECVQLMTVGSKYELTIPSQLAYGAQGAQDRIPPHSVLVFEVELLEINPAN